MRVLTLRGTPRQRGRAHGEALSTEIRQLLDGYEQFLGLMGQADPKAYLARLLDETRFLQAAERWTPDLVEEVRGIAEGSGTEFRRVLAWQFMEEATMWLPSYLAAGGNTAMGCSSLGVFGEGGPAVIAQNVDSIATLNGHQTLLRIEADGSQPEALVLTYPGLLGVYGLNRRGIGLCVNTLSRWMNESIDGLGSVFVHRTILAQPTLEAAEGFCRRIRHASGLNLTIGGPGRVIDLECSANKVVQFVPYPGATRVYHTNHPLASDDVRLGREGIDKLPAAVRERALQGWRNSEIRLQVLQERLWDASKPVTVAGIKEILSVHGTEGSPVCNHWIADAAGMTLACIIMVLAPNPTLHIAFGPPCCTEFQEFGFSDA